MMIQLGMVHPASGAPYERLLVDAIRNDTSLFHCDDHVEVARPVAEPNLGDTKPLAECERGTVGRGEA